MLGSDERKIRATKLLAIAATIVIHLGIAILLIYIALKASENEPEATKAEVIFEIADSTVPSPKDSLFIADSAYNTGKALSTAERKQIKKSPTPIIQTPETKALPPNISSSQSTNKQVIIQKTVVPPTSTLKPDPKAWFNKVGGGKNVSFALTGRSARNLPTPEIVCNEKGFIIINIWVNQAGRVVVAKINEKNSTIYSKNQLEMAEKSARKCVFAPDNTQPTEQAGTITYTIGK
jgi:hypothetical protein